MKKRQIILRLFIPAHEQAAKAIHPGMRPFHHPAACFEPGFSFDGLDLFPAGANVCGKAEFAQDVAHLVVVIALRQAHPLRLLLGWLGTVDDDAFDGRPHQFHIVAIGSLNRETDWHPLPLREQAALHAALAPVGGIGAGFFPRPTALWSWPHLSRASPSRSRRAHQTAPLRLATV
jgi:hypothetical protein